MAEMLQIFGLRFNHFIEKLLKKFIFSQKVIKIFIECAMQISVDDEIVVYV